MTQEIRTLSVIVIPEGGPIFSERATTIGIEDESGGEFVVVSQHGTRKVAFDPVEWPSVREAIDRMIKECRS